MPLHSDPHDERADRLLAGVDDPLTVVQTAAFEVLSEGKPAAGEASPSRDAEGRTGSATRESMPSESTRLHSVHHSLHPRALTEREVSRAGESARVSAVSPSRSVSIRAQLQVLEDDINEAWRAVELSRERMDTVSAPSMHSVANGCDWRAATYGWLARREVERAGLFRRLGDLHDDEREG